MPNTRTSIAPFLAVLQDTITRLPNTVPHASINDAIYQQFHEDPIANETAFQIFEQAFQRCFQPDPEGPLRADNVMRGEHGMDLIVSYIEETARYPAMSPEELKQMTLNIQKLVEVVHKRIKAAPMVTRCNPGGRRSQGGQKRTSSYTKRVARDKHVLEGGHSDLHDVDYTPGVGSESSGEEMDMEIEKELGILGFGKTGHKEDRIEPAEPRIPLGSNHSASSTDVEETSVGQIGPRPGRLPEKGDWALKNFGGIPTPAKRANGSPIWSFTCIWCRATRGFARTLGCTDWGVEVPEKRNFQRSNLISHLEKDCKKIPQDQQYSTTLRLTDKDNTGSSVGQALSQQDFNRALAKAVVHDNHSMTFGEGNGMIQFFQLVLPNIRLPSHQTLQRHLYHLFDVLGNKKITRHAIATDGWSSKNSVYTLAGVVLFFVDQNWHLRELVLDVINLDAEHSGVHMGKLLYRSLKAKGTAHQAIACVTDNASANSVMNTTLAKRIQEREDTHVHGKGMSFTCVNHAFHLVCVDILSHLGVIDPGDHYSNVKADEPESASDEDDEPGNEIGPELDSDSDSDLEDTLAELGLDLDSGDVENNGGGKATGGAGRNRGRSNKPKVLNAAEKVHEIMVYVTASPKRRKEMHRTIAQTCSDDKKHLFVKRSMRIRWGSVRAELKRAIELRSAVTHFVATLDSAKPRGKPRDRACKLQERWTLKSEEWDLLARLVEVLDPFHIATESMSRRDVPTLPEVIPTFALLERKLTDNVTKLQGKGHDNPSARALLSGLEGGLAKLQKYQALAHRSELCLVATVLNPRLRLKYLERWPESHSRAETIFNYIYESYRVRFAGPTYPPGGPASSSDSPPQPANHWDSEIYADVPVFTEQFNRELHEYYNGSYPCPPGMGILDWWKMHNPHFLTVARMARDFLCIPAASVSVERLFSQCKLTMTDVRSSMSFETARRRVCCQHWLEAGIDVDVVSELLGID